MIWFLFENKMFRPKGLHQLYYCTGNLRPEMVVSCSEAPHILVYTGLNLNSVLSRRFQLVMFPELHYKLHASCVH